MSNYLCVAMYPLLLLFSFPLIIFAFLTTTAAISTLFLRVLLVYADLAAVLIKNQISYHQPSQSTSPPTQGSQQSPRRSSTRSSSGDQHAFGGSRTPKSVESSGLGIYSAGSMQRDFEGVGGWRIPNTEGEDVLWTSMNARLELPAFGDGPHRHHRRAITASGTPMSARTRAAEQQDVETPVTPRALGTTSPQEYFVNWHASKSTTALGTVYR